jgi:hypothetical protein
MPLCTLRTRRRRPGTSEHAELAADALGAALSTCAPAALARAAELVGRLAGADACALVRFEDAPGGCVLGTWTVGTPRWRPGLVLDLEPADELRRIAEEGASLRVDAFEAGSVSRLAQLGYRCFAGIPLGWSRGAVAVAAVDAGGLPRDAAARVERCVALARLI